MSLLSLPPEILDKIVHESMPDGFEGLMLACKPLHHIGTRFLPEYNIKRKRFRHFQFSSMQDGIGPWDDCTNETGYVIPTLEDLMQTLAEDPTLGRYIHHADFKTAPATASHYRGLDTETRQALRALLASSPHLQEAQVAADEFTNSLAYYQADWVLLLTLLPNTTRLSLPPYWRCPAHATGPHDVDDPRGRFIWKLLSALVRRANDDALPHASLSKLQRLDPVVLRGRMWNTSPLDSLLPFLAINAVHEASLLRIDDTPRPLSPLWPSLGARLSRLDLVSCSLDHSQVQDLLSRLPALRTFRYAYGDALAPNHGEWNVSAIMDDLSRLFVDQLQELSLVTLRAPRHVMASTRSLAWKFRALKRLELSLDVMMGSYVEPCAGHELRWQDDLSLGEYLPICLEEFRLHVRPGSWGDPARRAMQLGRLRQLFVLGKREEEARRGGGRSLRSVRVYVYGDPGVMGDDVREALEGVRAWGAEVVHDNSGLEWADVEHDGSGEGVLDGYRKGWDEDERSGWS